jgi:hypothetical protein
MIGKGSIRRLPVQERGNPHLYITILLLGEDVKDFAQGPTSRAERGEVAKTLDFVV